MNVLIEVVSAMLGTLLGKVMIALPKGPQEAIDAIDEVQIQLNGLRLEFVRAMHGDAAAGPEVGKGRVSVVAAYAPKPTPQAQPLQELPQGKASKKAKK